MDDDYVYPLHPPPYLNDTEEYGDEDQETLMRLIENYKAKGEYTMDKESVAKVNALMNEIGNYEQTISDISGAMSSAEQELVSLLTDIENSSQPIE